MSDKEIEIRNELNAAERVGIILSFNLMLVKNGVDRRIVQSVKLNNNKIFINNIYEVVIWKKKIYVF